MKFARTIKEDLLQTSDTFKVVLLTGMRQVGKTTLLLECKEKERQFLTLDDLDLRTFAKLEPKLFIQKYKPPLIIDEIQYAPELLSYIKIMVDNSTENGSYWLTGSQPFHLMHGVSESLAGRLGILTMLGLSNQELNNNATKSKPFLPSFDITGENLELTETYHRIWRGSFPAICSQKELSWHKFYDNYVKTYIERDIRDLSKIHNESIFLQFLKILASRIGQLLNYQDIAKEIGMNQTTIKNWVSLLQTSGLVYLLQPYYNNITNRIVKTPKLYFMDTGLVSYLCGWQTAEVLETGAMNGAILENYIILEILKSYYNRGLSPNLYFYRDKNQKEIDLIIENNGILYPIEIKKTASPNLETIKHFKVLKNLKKPVGTGAVICLTTNNLPLTSEIISINLGLI